MVKGGTAFTGAIAAIIWSARYLQGLLRHGLLGYAHKITMYYKEHKVLTTKQHGVFGNIIKPKLVHFSEVAAVLLVYYITVSTLFHTRLVQQKYPYMASMNRYFETYFSSMRTMAHITVVSLVYVKITPGCALGQFVISMAPKGTIASATHYFHP